MLVSATSTPVTRTREKKVKTAEAIETAEAVETAKAVMTARIGKDGKESKDEYLENLTWVSNMRYPIIFQNKSIPVSALFNLGSTVNAILPTFARELGLVIRLTDVGV